MKRLNDIFTRNRAAQIPVKICSLTAGAVSADICRQKIDSLIQDGARIIELKVPFSDPTADTPASQSAAQTALKNNTTVADVLAMAKNLRNAYPELGIVVSSYYNVIFKQTVPAFAQQAAAAGVDGVLTLDLPFEECMEIKPELNKYQIAWISTVSSQTNAERAREILQNADSMVYSFGDQSNLDTILTVTELPIVTVGTQSAQAAGYVVNCD